MIVHRAGPIAARNEKAPQKNKRAARACLG